MSKNELPPSLNVTTEQRLPISDENSTRSKLASDWLPYGIALGLILIVGLFASMAYLAIDKAGQKDVESRRAALEKKRADSLQASLDTLQEQTDAIKARTGENQKFFETVRQLITVENEKDRAVLLAQLKSLRFGEATLSPSTTIPPSTSTTTIRTSVTSAPRSPTTTSTTRAPPPTTAPSTTTTTTRPVVTTPSTVVVPILPPGVVCLPTPLARLC